jgi:hypothetical protein
MVERIIEDFHNAIVIEATKRLGRPLTTKELIFVTQRQGLIALEMIMDTVNDLPSEELTRYMNSD